MESLAENSTPVPIGIRDWIESASKLSSTKIFLESAVNLAWMLTKRICQMVTSAPNVKIEDHITTDNIIIFVDLSPAMLRTNGSTMPTITDVKFQSEASGAMSLLLLTQTGAESSSTPVSCLPAVCAALGKILLEIFSKGRSSFIELSSGQEKNGDRRCMRTDRTMPPAEKRQATEPATDPSSSSTTAAHCLLLELGMPLSICQLVCDLLDAGNESPSNTGLSSTKEAFWDLTQMKTSPGSYLFERTCPTHAMVDTYLSGNNDEHLFGRELEMRVLMMARNTISEHVRTIGGNVTNDSVSHKSQGNSFVCELVFLRGYAGSGKSSLLHSVVNVCNEDQWFVLSCKFDKQAAPQMILAKAFDSFFVKWESVNNDTDSGSNPSMVKSFREVCRCISATLDKEGFDQLSDIMPNFARNFPLFQSRSNHRDQGGISSMDKVGSATKRRTYLFHALLKSLCSAGCPVLLSFDDLQWSQSIAIEGIADFIANYMNTHGAQSASEETCQQGLLVVGTFRSDFRSEVLMERINCIKQSGACVTVLTVDDLTKVDVTRLISSKLRLPWRYTQVLAGLVHSKTARGNPFFVVQFLRSIIQNKMLEFSIRHRRWMWDCDVVDMQMISDDVAKLLTTTFSKLPSSLMQTLMIVSCLGSQVEESTIIAMNSRNEVLRADMMHELGQAVREGIMEKAGPMYQFTHDIIQQTIYERVPLNNQKALHKVIGDSLLKSAANNPTIHLLALDQINIFGKDGNLSHHACAQYAHANANGAKFAIEASSFEQARSYIDIGIQLLNAEHWQTQYSLSLDLFEMSASISCVHGDTPNMTRCLKEILSHGKTFDDTLKASSLLVKLLHSSCDYEGARNKCLLILSNFGEVFPPEVSMPCVLNELSTIKVSLRNITYNQIKLLPRMTDRNKLNAMKFLNMLCMNSMVSKPRLLPFLSFRMVKLTLEHGFCDDSIVGLATVGHSVVTFTEDVQFASQIGEVSKSLVEESPNKHTLRARLCLELAVTLKMSTEPWHSARACFPELYNSAMMAGDVENAMVCRFSYCAVGFWGGVANLVSLTEQHVQCIHEAIKHGQNSILYIALSDFNTILHLSGTVTSDVDVDVKSFDEIDEIGERTNFSILAFRTYMGRMSSHFWMSKFADAAQLSEEYSKKHPLWGGKRMLEIVRILFEGISYLNLARDTKQEKWRILGENAVVKMSKITCTWGFENKYKLLQAELHYLNGDHQSADTAYMASIKSAQEHEFMNEEALGYELYGRFCVENQQVDKGSRQLQLAREKYQQWGAIKKADDVQMFIDQVDLANCQV